MKEPHYDALLILAYGGPESPDEVRPYLTRLLAGKSCAPAAFESACARYVRIGGKSPMMGEIRSFAAAAREWLGGFPVHIGCLYNPPFIEDALREIAAAGRRRVLVLIASPFGAEGIRRRYTDRLDGASSLAPRTVFEFAPPFAVHPKWIRAQADLALSLLARRRLEQIRWEGPDKERPAVLLFTAHSLPLRAAGGYAAELEACAARITEALSPCGVPGRLVYQSRSGPAETWLGPDIGEFIAEYSASRPEAADCLVLPIGFFFENLETVCDLDVDLKAVAAERSVTLRRAPTASHSPEVLDMVADFLSDPPLSAAETS